MPLKRFLGRSERVQAKHGPAWESLENRRLFAVSVATAIQPVLAHPASPSTDSFRLDSDFGDPNITGTIVKFDTSLGPVEVALTDSATPLTVQNFLNYVKSGAYDNTIFHRNALLTSSGGGGSPKSPADIVQGGGYVVNGNSVTHISTNAPVNDEFSTALYKDVAGTLAMAKTSSANSATSEFYFNIHNNSAALDTPTTDSSGTTTAYTVFGKVLGSGMTILDTLAALPTVDLSAANSALNTLPVLGIPESMAKSKNVIVRPSQLVYTKDVSVLSGFTYTAQSDNPLLVKPTVVGNTLSFAYAAGQTGVANITVTATDIDGSTATQTFPVTVPNTAAPTQGPTAAAVTPTNVYTGATANLNLVANDTDSLAALKPAGITISTAPAHGVATVNATTGMVAYTPAAGYAGPDSFAYIVPDTLGNVSSPATVSFTVTGPPVQVTIGSAAARSLTFTQPDGVVGHLSVTGGTALVTFADTQVQLTTAGDHVTATGTGTTLSDITITNAKNRNANLTLTASKRAVTVGSINDTGVVSLINAPAAALTGNLTVGGLGRLILASTNRSFLSIGAALPQTILVIPVATDTNIQAASFLNSVISNRWVNTTNIDESITAAGIGALRVAGNFADSLNLSAPLALRSANIGGQITGGFWSLAGSAGNVIARSVASAWGFFSTGSVNRMHLGGNVTSAITAQSIGVLQVTGSLNAAISTTGSFVAGQNQLGRLIVGGGIVNSTINSAGNIGMIVADSLVGTDIYAGVDSATTAARILPVATTDFSASARIANVRLRGKTAFSNSRIAADNLGSMQLATVDPSNGGVAEGVAGHIIRLLTGQLTTGAKLRLGPAQLATAAKLSAFLTKKKITLSDFAIDVL